MQQAPEKPAAHPLQFEGVPMRASLEEVQRAEPGFQLAQRSVDGHVQMLYGKELHPNGIEATTSSAALYNGRLAEVLVKFRPEDAARVYQSLVASFGAPTVEITPGQCNEDYRGCAAAWYHGSDALTFNGPGLRYAMVDTTLIDTVRESMGLPARTPTHAKGS